MVHFLWSYKTYPKAYLLIGFGSKFEGGGCPGLFGHPVVLFHLARQQLYNKH